MFAEYADKMGQPAPAIDVAGVPALRENLLLELPAEYEEGIGYKTVEPDGTGVDWQGRMTEIAGGVYEDWAAMPLIGPTGAQFDPNTGAQISAGGERMWSTDETGAPVMIEVTTTPSPLTEKYHSLGLPTPDEEYTAEDFQSPELTAMQQAYSETTPQVDALKQAWMDPALAPSNTYTPARPQPAMPNLTADQLAGIAGAGGGGGGGGAATREVVPPVPGYPPTPIDVTGEIPTALADAIRNGDDAEWMAQNWESMRESDRTAAREV